MWKRSENKEKMINGGGLAMGDRLMFVKAGPIGKVVDM
jgi:hypothetical protein